MGPGPDTVTLADDAFPGDRTVDVATELTFVNDGQHAHTVTIQRHGDLPGTLKSDRELAPTESTQFRFTQRGTYDVWCSIHGASGSGMHMTVMVV